MSDLTLKTGCELYSEVNSFAILHKIRPNESTISDYRKVEYRKEEEESEEEEDEDETRKIKATKYFHRKKTLNRNFITDNRPSKGVSAISAERRKPNSFVLDVE